MIDREKTGRALLLAGVAAAVPSVLQTASHVTDPGYVLPEQPHGKGHVQYHMARETLISAGALGAVLAGTAAPRRSRATWRAVALAAGGFVAGMWSGGPTTGVWAPNGKALAIHVVSTSALAAGVALLRPRSRRAFQREQ